MLENLEKVRKDKNVSLNQIADLLGYTRYQTISSKIQGQTKFYFDEALLIQKVLFPEYKIEYLFTQDKPKQPS